MKEISSFSEKLQNIGAESKIFGNSSEYKNFLNGDEVGVKKMLPREKGSWEGEVGDSTWKPDLGEIPKKPPGNQDDWKTIFEPYGKEGIDFKDGEPDFTPFSEGSVEIKDFSDDRLGNFSQADEQMAKIWSEEKKDGRDWSAEDVYNYRKENGLSWHERSDMKTMDLVPQKIHGNVPHSGGISAYKNLQGVA